MRPIVYYTLALACIGLLMFSYIEHASDVSYYPFPGEVPSDTDHDVMWLIKGAVEARGRVYRGYEIAYAPHSPVNDTLESIELPEDIYPLIPVSSENTPTNEGPLKLFNDQDDENACSPPTYTDLNNSIALVGRDGGCSFAAKILNCQTKGALGVIISGDTSLDTLVNDTSHIYGHLAIPGFILSPSDFNELRTLALDNEVARLWTLPSDNVQSLLSFLILLFIRPAITMAVVIFIFHGNEEIKKRRMRAKPEAVEALPTHEWNSEELSEFQQTSCSICLEQYSDGCEVLMLPCHHEFHKTCVSQWLLWHRKVCPLCFHDITEARETV